MDLTSYAQSKFERATRIEDGSTPEARGDTGQRRERLMPVSGCQAETPYSTKNPLNRLRVTG